MTAAPELHPLGALMRRFAVDWLDRADPAVPAEIMAPDYTIVIGAYTMRGREDYVEATSGQLARFPGLTITVHDALYTPDGRVALRFTEHGASARGGAAAWRGIGLFTARDGVLVHNACEEDYLGRRRQLHGGAPDPVDPPMVAPWTEPVAGPDTGAEEAVRSWLAAGRVTGPLPGVVADDGRGADPVLDDVTCEVTALFAAGRRVAFHAVARGRYAGGLPDAPGATGTPVALGIAGLVEPGADGTVTGHVVRDRLGLHRTLERAR
ncbi:nuclear transport factor 2 family protein [Pseudonocardia alni]|uniref:nuclear transport factor 2 family protein n=1 Tax=Pseudonocardia alni TaxID=33907 RepID=UPI00331C7831